MAEDSVSSDVGARYAQALFDVADEAGALDAVQADLKALKAMLRESGDLRALVTSPRFVAEDQSRALQALAEKAKFSDTTRKFLGLLALNRRLATLAAVTAAFEALLAKRRGVVSAEVVTAAPMTREQSTALAAALREALGGDPAIETRVDPALLGGFRVRIGSRLYDASLKSKLESLKFALKRA